MSIFGKKQTIGTSFEYQRRDSAGQAVYRARAEIDCAKCGATIPRDSFFVQGDERQNFCNKCRPVEN